MRLIKNFLHNINDIVLAVIIVVLAAGIIYWRMQSILDYPEQLADQQAVYTEQAEEADPAEETAPAEDTTAAEQAEADQPEDTTDTPADNTESEEQPQG